MSDMDQLFGTDSEDEGNNSNKQKSASNSPSGSSGSSSSSDSDDEAASNRSGSASPAGSLNSGPASPTGSHRSGSASPAGSHRSGSTSPAGSRQSGSASPPGSHQSAPSSPASSGSSSRSHTPVGSPAKSASGPASPTSPNSGSEASSRSRSPSPAGSAASIASGKSPAAEKQQSHGSPASAASHQSKSSSKGSRNSTPVNRGDNSGSDSDIPIRGKARIASDSDSGSDSEMKPRQRLASDSGSDPDAVRATAEDIFGEAGDISDDEKEDEPEEKEEVIPETRIEVEIPRVVADLGEKLSFAKLPNFLSVETRPFDPATYEDEIDEDEVMDEEGRARLKLKVENTIRWRYVKDSTTGEVETDEFGEKKRESNCKVIKWSDGSMSLHLGTEIFDVFSMPMQDHNHLYIRQGTGLQGQAMFKNKLSFRPHSTESFTHRKMTMSLADRSSKTGKIKVLPIAGVDPELSKTDNIKKEEERLRASVRRENQQRRTRERGHGRGRLDASFLDDGISLNAIKSSYKKRTNAQSRDDLSDSADEDYETDGEEDMRRNRLQKAKRLADSDDNSSDQQDSDGETVKKKSKVMSGSESD